MGGIFTSILPGADKTLIQSMTVFGVSMGGLLGGPVPLAEILGSDIKKAYRAGGVPFVERCRGELYLRFSPFIFDERGYIFCGADSF